MASAGGGAGGLPAAEAKRAGSKRGRDPLNSDDSHGLVGVTTAEKKSTLQHRSNDKCLKKAVNDNPVLRIVDGNSKAGGLYVHDTQGSQTPPDSSALRSSPPGGLENKTRKPTKICIFYTQGRCKKGKSCSFLHEGKVSGFDNQWSKEEKAGLLASVGYGNHRGTEEGSEVQCLSNLKEPQLKNSVGSSKSELYRTLIHAYGEDNGGLTHPIDKHLSPVLNHTAPINEVVQLPTVQEKNHAPYLMRHHISLTSNSHLDGRGTFPRMHVDEEKLQVDMAKGGGRNDYHVSGTYLELNPLKPDCRYQQLGSSISLDYLQHNKKLSAYGGRTEDLPHKHQKEHSSSHVSYSSNSSTTFRNPGRDSSNHSLTNPPLRGTSPLRTSSPHQLTPGIKVSCHKDFDFGKGGTSGRALLESSSPQLVAASAGHLSPIKDEVWITSVPFVPSFDFPYSTSPSKSQYDPLVDSMDPPKIGSISNLKSSNISCSISSQHADENVIISGKTESSLRYDDKLARNISAKGSNEFAGLIISDRGHSSSLDGDNRVKAAVIDEKVRQFRFGLAEHVKELVKPVWKEGFLSKDAHKLIVKKSVDKVFASLETDQIPATEELINSFITASGPKIEKLVKAYVDKHRTK